MDLSTDHIAVRVSFGGEETFSFNLDTYAVTTACVDERFARRMGFEKVDVVRNGDGSGEFRERDIVLIPELRFGGATFKDVRALVDDYSWVKTPTGGSIDGLLGYHLFRDLLLELDYPGKRVVLRRGELPADEPHVISAEVLKQQPDVPLKIGAERFVFGIDSGAASSLSLPAEYLDRLALAQPPVVAGRAKTVYKEAEILTATLSDPLLLAGHEHPGLTGTFSELFGKPLLGHGFLRRYRVTFDQKHGRVRFQLPEKRKADGDSSDKR